MKLDSIWSLLYNGIVRSFIEEHAKRHLEQ
jgi:hypothetical protein